MGQFQECRASCWWVVMWNWLDLLFCLPNTHGICNHLIGLPAIPRTLHNIQVSAARVFLQVTLCTLPEPNCLQESQLGRIWPPRFPGAHFIFCSCHESSRDSGGSSMVSLQPGHDQGLFLPHLLGRVSWPFLSILTLFTPQLTLIKTEFSGMLNFFFSYYIKREEALILALNPKWFWPDCPERGMKWWGLGVGVYIFFIHLLMNN